MNPHLAVRASRVQPGMEGGTLTRKQAPPVRIQVTEEGGVL